MYAATYWFNEYGKVVSVDQSGGRFPAGFRVVT